VPDPAAGAIREAAGSLVLDGGSATVIIGRE
jgi:hypothetical protein